MSALEGIRPTLSDENRSMSHTYADALVIGQRAHARKPADFYPTPADVTEALLQFLKLPPEQYIWEPACGDGAMSRVIERHGHQVLSTDLREDSGYGEGGIDFLAFDVDPPSGIPFSAVYNDWIITNPPFNLAEAFIRKALSITPNVAMLLKSQYWHAARRLALFEEHRPSWVLPLTWRPAFLEAERGRSPLMDVIWVVWQGKANFTDFQPLRRPVFHAVPKMRQLPVRPSTSLTALLA